MNRCWLLFDGIKILILQTGFSAVLTHGSQARLKYCAEVGPQAFNLTSGYIT